MSRIPNPRPKILADVIENMMASEEDTDPAQELAYARRVYACIDEVVASLARLHSSGVPQDAWPDGLHRLRSHAKALLSNQREEIELMPGAAKRAP